MPGCVWIGPPPEAQAALGNKLAARRSVAAAGVPIVPGLRRAARCRRRSRISRAVGYPAMLKAAAGGGGRGMRRIEQAADLPDVLAAAQREAAAAFGDGTVYVERLVSPARHVEVQLLGDGHGHLVCLGERDCSVQRRHQKLVEETPSPAVTPGLREALFDSARRVAGTVPFSNAATVEFLVDAEGHHYFLEMNTRLQVEHGVTELTTGSTSSPGRSGSPRASALSSEVLEVQPRGHAIEVRRLCRGSVCRIRPGRWRRQRLAPAVGARGPG